jgi:1-hydroxycarotenoid 3,4-desaturase
MTHLPPANRPPPVVIIGAGVGGLSLAARLASRGMSVVLLEKEPEVGGKLRVMRVPLDGQGRPGDAHLGWHLEPSVEPHGEPHAEPHAEIDAGPTVLTMRWVFDELFRECGASLDDHLSLTPLELIARHRFRDGEVLDLFSDRRRSAAAVARMAGEREASAFLRFCDHCDAIYDAVEEPFLRSALPGATDLLGMDGLLRLRALARIDATRTLWRAVSSFFSDERLRVLFGRYATYAGSSPFKAPGTLNVIASVEQRGAWVVAGGMSALGKALRGLCERAGARVVTGARVAKITVERGRASGVTLSTGEHIAASAVVTNGDVAALGALVGPCDRSAKLHSLARHERSLSALVLTTLADTSGFPLAHHNVFFSSDYRAEFTDLFERGALPSDPTIYVCAQDRGPLGGEIKGPERLLVLVNAPARGDAPGFLPPGEASSWISKVLVLLQQQGLHIRPRSVVLQSPRDFERLSPGTGGALYGPASHGMMSAFARPACRTPLPGLYAVGGSAHPGAGLPMVALSARIAEAMLCRDLAATFPSPTPATRGGTSMASATAAATP